MEPLRACHSQLPLDTKAFIVLPEWHKFKALTPDLKLIKQFPTGKKVFMRTNPTGTSDPLDLITSDWVIRYWLMDTNTHVCHH